MLESDCKTILQGLLTGSSFRVDLFPHHPFGVVEGVQEDIKFWVAECLSVLHWDVPVSDL